MNGGMENLAVAGLPAGTGFGSAQTMAPFGTHPTPMKITQILALSGLALCAVASFALADDQTAPADTPIAPVPPGVALRAATVRVIVAPDHRDWTYTLGEHALF